MFRKHCALKSRAKDWSRFRREIDLPLASINHFVECARVDITVRIVGLDDRQIEKVAVKNRGVSRKLFCLGQNASGDVAVIASVERECEVLQKICSRTPGRPYFACGEPRSRSCRMTSACNKGFIPNGAKISIAFVEDGGELHAFYDGVLSGMDKPWGGVSWLLARNG